jgi:hypothetical protein
MPHPPTTNYGINKPLETDSMADFEPINTGWDKLADAISPPSGTTLPQSGTYNVGDRFYKSDTSSVYILLAKDANWGWHWRPVQDAISPWLAVPATCLNLGTWTINPVAANPLAIAFDNRGKCYWRGVIGISSGTIPRNVSHAVFKPLPVGLTPRQQGVYMCGHETIAVGTAGTSLNSWQGARIFIPENGTSNPSIRCYGGTAEFNRVYVTGVNYAVGTAKYTAV